jgi:uroporphyrinogen-III synthase
VSLTGKRILVTRTRHQASELASGLEAVGAVPILIPTIEIVHPPTLPALDSALACIGTYDWLIFTSSNAVEAFHRRAQFFRLSQLPHKIAVIGPATLKAANEIGLPVDLIPAQVTAEGLASSLTPQAEGQSFLLIRAAEARDVLPNALREAGGLVTIAEAYRNSTLRHTSPMSLPSPAAPQSEIFPGC